MEFSLETLMVIVGIVSLILSFYFNRKTLQQSEKNLKTQLLHDDRKNALFKMNKILEDENYFSVKYKLLKLFDSSEGQYIPQDIKKHILINIKKIEKILKKENLYKLLKETEPPISEEDMLAKQYEEIERQNDPFEFVKDRIKEKFLQFKKDILEKSREALKNPIKY